jgi:hypothetical protein
MKEWSAEAAFRAPPTTTECPQNAQLLDHPQMNANTHVAELFHHPTIVE